MAIATGAKAPDFTLKTSDMSDVKLSDSFDNGKSVVLVFFPAAFSGVCTEEMCSISDGVGFKAGDQTDVFGISADSPFALAAWAKASGIKTTLLSDYKREVIEAYDVVWPNLAGAGPSAARAVVVIDKDGVVRYTQVTPEPKVLPDFAEVQKALDSLA